MAPEGTVEYLRDSQSGNYAVCKKYRKRRYRSAESAERMMAHLIVHGSASQVPYRAYACDFCQGWHLTSQTRKRG